LGVAIGRVDALTNGQECLAVGDGHAVPQERIDEVSIRKGPHLPPLWSANWAGGDPIWFGGLDRP
jgi:hypothetical protein